MVLANESANKQTNRSALYKKLVPQDASSGISPLILDMKRYTLVPLFLTVEVSRYSKVACDWLWTLEAPHVGFKL